MKQRNITLLTDDLLIVQGRDAVKFLQGLSTCNLETIPTNTLILGSCCTPKGRMIANFRIGKIDDLTFGLVMPTGQAQILKVALEKYAKFYQVQININPNWQRIGLFTDQLEIKPPTMKFLVDDKRIEIWAMDDIWNNLRQKYLPISTEFWQLQDIEQGIGWITPKITEVFLPQECNWDLLGGVSFEKGCYTGQEIIARLHFRGKAKSRLRYLVSEKTIEIGESLLNDQEKICGKVVTCLVQAGKSHILASMRQDQNLAKLPDFIVKIMDLPYFIE